LEGFHTVSFFLVIKLQNAHYIGEMGQVKSRIVKELFGENERIRPGNSLAL